MSSSDGAVQAHGQAYASPLPKTPSGIRGFDEITGGGLPTGRPTLVCGGPGCGKTLFAMEFLVRGIVDHDEPGVFMAFEESPEDLAKNVASLGFDLARLQAEGKLAMDHVVVDRNEIEETGEFDLEALFIRLGWAIDSVGAKRVVLDTIETLFAALPNEFILRAELQRLFRWLKDRGVTVVITGERGDGTLTRQGLEEYVSDCVVLLDHRVIDQVSTRRLRVVKYRGTSHGTNEYPFLIDRDGYSVLPITGLSLDHDVSDERVSTGVPKLDGLLGGGGYYRGTTVLVSGTAGTGKTSLCAQFADAACRRGERVLYFAFEESARQLVRNMRSIGVDLQPHLDSGKLLHRASRPTAHGLEMHLALMHRDIEDFAPQCVVIDPITNLVNIGTSREVQAMLMRLVDHLKTRGITAVCSSLTGDGAHIEHTDVGISSIIDTWFLLRSLETNGERNRGFYILKSRGMAHSNQVREFVLTERGIDLVDVYVGSDGVLVGSARTQQERTLRNEAMLRAQERERRRQALERKREAMEAQIASLRAELEAELVEFSVQVGQEDARANADAAERQALEGQREALRRPLNGHGVGV